METGYKDPRRAHEELKRWVQERTNHPFNDGYLYDVIRGSDSPEPKWYAKYVKLRYYKQRFRILQIKTNNAWRKFWSVPPMVHPVYSRKVGKLNKEYLEDKMMNWFDAGHWSKEREDAAKTSGVSARHGSAWRSTSDSRLPEVD